MKPHHINGVVLVTALVMLLILTLLGISGTQTLLLHTRMASNLHQMHQAFQAAEAALRDGEAHIATQIDQDTLFSTTCDQGLCATATLGETPWESDLVNWQNGQNTILYGSHTGNPAYPTNTKQPRYIIERLPTPSSELTDPSVPTRLWYRVTAVSYTPRGTIQHILQSTYRQ